MVSLLWMTQLWDPCTPPPSWARDMAAKLQAQNGRPDGGSCGLIHDDLCWFDMNIMNAPSPNVGSGSEMWLWVERWWPLGRRRLTTSIAARSVGQRSGLKFELLASPDKCWRQFQGYQGLVGTAMCSHHIWNIFKTWRSKWSKGKACKDM